MWLKMASGKFLQGPPFEVVVSEENNYICIDWEMKDKVVECVETTLPDFPPTDPNYIVDGTTSDYKAWKDSWTCWAFKEDYAYCTPPEERHSFE